MTKEFIVDEIRRVALELGRAPGRGEFFARTGITPSQVAGVFWPTWGDALADAGFEPNALQKAHSDVTLVASLADLTRELEHYPTRNEMRLKRRADPAFPTHGAFDRFPKHELITRVRDYCETTGGYEDVIKACDAALDVTPKTNKQTRPEPTAVHGFVYMIGCGSGKYKIGRTNSPLRRHREIRLDIPFATSLVHSIATDDPAGIEAYWHKRFEVKQIPGTQEFFKLDAADVAAFKRRKVM